MGWTIVNTLDLSGAPEAIQAAEEVGRLISVPASRTAVFEVLAQADAYLASASIRIDAEFLDNAPRLKVIGSPSTGTDHMELSEITRRGIVMFDIAKERALLDGF